MAWNWEPLLKKEKNAKHLLNGLAMHMTTNMTLFQPLYEVLLCSLFENLTILSAFNVFGICVKITACSVGIFWFCPLFPASNLFTETSLYVSSVCRNRYCKDTGDEELFYFYSAYAE